MVVNWFINSFVTFVLLLENKVCIFECFRSFFFFFFRVVNRVFLLLFFCLIVGKAKIYGYFNYFWLEDSESIFYCFWRWGYFKFNWRDEGGCRDFSVFFVVILVQKKQISVLEFSFIFFLIHKECADFKVLEILVRFWIRQCWYCVFVGILLQVFLGFFFLKYP